MLTVAARAHALSYTARMHSRFPYLSYLLALALLSASVPASAAPLFTQATARLGSPQPCGPGPGEGCYSNYVVIADLDRDTDLDAVFASGGGYYEPGQAEPMAVYLNDGNTGNFSEVSATATGGFAGRLRQIAVGDIDGDGDNDIVAPDAWAMQPDAVFIHDNAAPGTFDNEPARLGTSSRWKAWGARRWEAPA